MTDFQPKSFYHCGVCKKEYTRADHLVRHVRSHTADKPFRCQVCRKGFARIDLLRRHTQGHGPIDGGDGDNVSSGIRGRVSQACKSCASSKLKCDDEKPCRRCVRRNQLCQWTQKDGLLEEMHVAAPQSEVLANDGKEPEEQGPSGPVMEPQGVTQLGRSVSSSGSAKLDASPDEMITDNQIGETTDSMQPIMQPAPHDQPMVGSSTFLLTNPDEWEIPGSWDIDFSLTDEHLEFLDSLTGSGPSMHVSDDQSTRDSDLRQAPSSEMNAETIHHTPLSQWNPGADDNAFMDQQYLSVPEHLDIPGSPRSIRDRVLAEYVSRDSRDAVFAIVVSICQRKDSLRIMKCFPSADLLDRLIQDFLKHQTLENDSFIHIPTMQINRERPEMILTLAASGASLSSVEAIQRLGYTIMEIARLLVNEKFEHNNVLTRDLRQQQQYVLILQIGIWSGDKRRIEIAESFTQPIVTMLRRASRFIRDTYPTVIIDPTDDDNAVYHKWHEWVELESFKRLVYRVFHHDVQASLLRSTNPLMSYSELDLPLPLSRDVWDARTATEWKALYLQRMSTESPSVPSLATVIQEIPILGRFPPHGDFQLAAFATVHGILSMITDCNQIRRGPSGQWCGVVMKIWQHELQQNLDQFYIFAVAPLQTKAPSIILLYHMISLSLYMPPGVLETFAGKGGETRSSNTYKTVLQHIGPEDLRKTGWHAGQILRIARSMPTLPFSPFCASCLYLAALATWAVSTLFSTSALDATLDQNGDVFLLNDDSGSAALQRFIISGHGIPAFKGLNQVVHLSDRGRVMNLFQQVLESKQRGGCSPKQTKALHYMLTVLGGQRKAESTR